jgi:NAD(P)-dependent dehydrogenase (short-subunit alcohol dehydrogenase family)
VSDVNAVGAEETAQLVTKLGGTARASVCDVTQPEQVEALALLADRELGGADLLVNNAGVAVAGLVGDIPLADWTWIFGVNLWGVVHGCHAFVPRFKRQQRGHILNVASAAGLLCPPEMAPYNVTKAGVVALSETLYSELKSFGVGVTVLCPTYFQTDIINNARTHSVTEVRGTAERLMQASKIQAPEVAARALSACAADELYCVPMLDGKIGQRLKGLAPEAFYKRVMPTLMSAMRKLPARR